MVRITSEDAERRRMLNEERTPRENFIYEVEATNNVNPITGRSYWAEGDSDYVKNSLLGGVSYSDKSNNLINIYVPATTSEFIEYQFALARAEVRDGKLSQGEYDVQLRNVSAVIKRFREGRIPLDCITSPEALKNAMNDIALSEAMRKLGPLEGISRKYYPNSLISNEGYSPDFPDKWWKRELSDLSRMKHERDSLINFCGAPSKDDWMIKEKSQF